MCILNYQKKERDHRQAKIRHDGQSGFLPEQLRSININTAGDPEYFIS